MNNPAAPRHSGARADPGLGGSGGGGAYAAFGSPQMLNLYAFVGNNPLSWADDDGSTDYRVVNARTARVLPAWAPGTRGWRPESARRRAASL